MYLGIEIGGTKLQLGVGSGDGSRLVALAKLDVEPERGAARIREQIVQAARPLAGQYAVKAIGVGFGGPVEAASGQTITSHQISGWDRFGLVDWCRAELGLPVVLSNDSDAAGLAEARFGGGRGRRVVFYTNAGSGIGGALVIDGHVYGGASGVASELGHLRPGLEAERPDQTVESLASGWAIAGAVRTRIRDHRVGDEEDAEDLVRRSRGRVEDLSTNLIAAAASEGNRIARDAFDRACRAYGWAIAQMVTLLAPEVVVVGGGVSMAGKDLFLTPLQAYVSRYVFPPLKGSYALVEAIMGEQVVVQGVLALAAERALQT